MVPHHGFNSQFTFFCNFENICSLCWSLVVRAAAREVHLVWLKIYVWSAYSKCFIHLLYFIHPLQIPSSSSSSSSSDILVVDDQHHFDPLLNLLFRPFREGQGSRCVPGSCQQVLRGSWRWGCSQHHEGHFHQELRWRYQSHHPIASVPQ